MTDDDGQRQQTGDDGHSLYTISKSCRPAFCFIFILATKTY
jgi:hypothetical protein